MDIKTSLIKKIRADFPIFSNGKTIYLDSAATSHKPKSVIDAVIDFYSNYNANVHRAIYGEAERATLEYEKAREIVAAFINAEPEEVVFTKGCTESINFIADRYPANNILVTQVEHHANLLPWQKKNLSFIPIDLGNYNPLWEDCITSNTELVSVTAYSNILGKIWKDGELKSLISKAHDIGARVLIDAAQYITHYKLDVKDLNVDFVAFSGHKMLGPTGIGVLYIKKGIDIEPYQLGGSMVFSAGFKKSTWKEAPNKYEAGTPPIAQAIGLGAAIEYINKVGYQNEHINSLCRKLIKGLDEVGGIKIIGNKKELEKSGHLVTFLIDGVHAHDAASYLDMNNISVRAGHHCVQPFHDLLGISSTLRASLYIYNTEDDVNKFIKEMHNLVKYFETGLVETSLVR